MGQLDEVTCGYCRAPVGEHGDEWMLRTCLRKLSVQTDRCCVELLGGLPPLPDENPEYQQGWIDAVEAMRDLVMAKRVFTESGVEAGGSNDATV
jgi:hypothetical protein